MSMQQTVMMQANKPLLWMSNPLIVVAVESVRRCVCAAVPFISMLTANVSTIAVSLLYDAAASTSVTSSGQR